MSCHVFCARARGPRTSGPKSARTETQTQQNTVHSSVFWLGSRARAPEGPKTNGDKARTEQRTSQPQQKQHGQNNSPKLSIAVLTIFAAFCRARTQHCRHAQQRLAPKHVKMSLAYIPLAPSQKQCDMGCEAFWKEGSMMQTKPR